MCKPPQRRPHNEINATLCPQGTLVMATCFCGTPKSLSTPRPYSIVDDGKYNKCSNQLISMRFESNKADVLPFRTVSVILLLSQAVVDVPSQKCKSTLFCNIPRPVFDRAAFLPAVCAAVFFVSCLIPGGWMSIIMWSPPIPAIGSILRSITC